MNRLMLAAAIIVAAGGMPASAHHSFAMFDLSKTQTLTGTIKEFQWTAPHALIWFIEDRKPGDAEDAAGGTLWTIELGTSPGPLSRLGWTKKSIVPGDRVVIEISPLRTGEAGGSFKKLTIVKTGVVLTAGSVSAPPDPAPSSDGKP